MLHVLRHYLPVRKALLVLSETVLLTLCVMAGMSSHLWIVLDSTKRLLAQESLDEIDARWVALVSSFLVAVLAQVAIAFNELYDFRISSSRFDRAARFLSSAGSAILLSNAAVIFFEIWGIPRVLDFPGLPLSQRIVILSSSLVLGFALLYLWRHAFHAVLRRTSFDERVLILGAGRLAQRLADELLSRPASGYQVAGMLVGTEKDEAARRGGERRRRQEESHIVENPWAHAVGRAMPIEDGGPAPALVESARGPRAALADLPSEKSATLARLRQEHTLATNEPIFELAQRLDVDDVVVALEDRRGSMPTDELLRCRLAGIVVVEAESFYERITGKIPAEAMRPSYLIFNPGFLQHPLAQLAKRLLDIGVALAMLALVLPVMAVVALLIKLDSPGPVFFSQERSGLLGRPFTLFKFRSMRADAEKESGPVWASKGDPRITRLGGTLRKLRLDELPQLFNVVAGQMSLVGPRPERPPFVAELAERIPYYHQRHVVKPGITGWAQINYPYGNTLEDALQKLQYDLFYIKYQSLLFDLSILFHTVKTVVLRKGT